MDLLLFVLALVLDFLIAAVGLWIITLVLSAFGVAITFSWGLAFGFWVILKVLKMIL